MNEWMNLISMRRTFSFLSVLCGCLNVFHRIDVRLYNILCVCIWKYFTLNKIHFQSLIVSTKLGSRVEFYPGFSSFEFSEVLWRGMLPVREFSHSSSPHSYLVIFIPPRRGVRIENSNSLLILLNLIHIYINNFININKLRQITIEKRKKMVNSIFFLRFVWIS